MSMTTKLIKGLRSMTLQYSAMGVPETEKIMKQAADTIEELSTKVAQQNMDKSSKYHNGGWIPCDEVLPEVGQPVLVSDKCGNVCVRTITSQIRGEKHWSKDKYDVIAWRKLPPAYEPKDVI